MITETCRECGGEMHIRAKQPLGIPVLTVLECMRCKWLWWLSPLVKTE